MRNFKDPLTYALYLLELRDRSVGEIKEKMQRKKFDEKEISEVISFLESKNFVNDAKFAERFVKEKQELQHWGQYRIKTELFKKHISNELIDAIFSVPKNNSYHPRLDLPAGRHGRGSTNSLSVDSRLHGNDNDYNQTSDEICNAREAADLWRRKNPNCPKEKIYQRLGSFLSRRGFSYDVVKEILDEH